MTMSSTMNITFTAGLPAYNRDRGPVSIVGARIHADF